MAQATGKLPLALEHRPRELGPVATQYFEAFMMLDHFRDLNGNLSFSDMTRYADIVGDDPLEFVSVMVSVNKSFTQALKDKKETQDLLSGMIASV